MNQKNKIRHAQREAREEKQAKKVVAWIFGVLVVLAVICLALTMID